MNENDIIEKEWMDEWTQNIPQHKTKKVQNDTNWDLMDNIWEDESIIRQFESQSSDKKKQEFLESLPTKGLLYILRNYSIQDNNILSYVMIKIGKNDFQQLILGLESNKEILQKVLSLSPTHKIAILLDKLLDSNKDNFDELQINKIIWSMTVNKLKEIKSYINLNTLDNLLYRIKNVYNNSDVIINFIMNVET